MKEKHGANLFVLAENLHCGIEEFIDFSSNINPYGLSEKAMEKLRLNLDKVSIYPNPNYTLLKKSIAKYCACKEEDVLLGLGASTFISACVRILSPKIAMILSPAYSEYEKELDKIDAKIIKYSLRESRSFAIDVEEMIALIHREKVQVLILCNPNNPTGGILTREEIEKILIETKVYVVVDETYIEFTNQAIYGSSPLCGKFDRLFVIRGTSKFFSCPGIRLGYGVTSDLTIKKRFEAQYNGLWDINIFADIMGQEMFADQSFISQTYEKISMQREYVCKELEKISVFKVYKTYGNFVLVKINVEKFTASDLYEYLLQKKLIIRDCSSFESLGEKYFRICFLEKKDNEKLLQEIHKYVQLAVKG